MNYIFEMIKEIFATYLEIAPYLFIGLTFAGLLHILFNRDFILNHMGRNNFWSVLKASVLGCPYRCVPAVLYQQPYI